RYQVQLKKQPGDELRGPCPIHKGHNPDSFHANTEKNCFQCFSCGKRGNVLDFVAAMENCSVRDAALKLQQWFMVGGAAGAAEQQTTAAESGGAVVNPPLAFQLHGIDH